MTVMTNWIYLETGMRVVNLSKNKIQRHRTHNRIPTHRSRNPWGPFQTDSAPQLVTPDFVALHILVEILQNPTNNHLRRRYEHRAGYRIIHECCPLVVEIKPFPSPISVKPATFRREILSRLAAAKKAWDTSVTTSSSDINMHFGQLQWRRVAITGHILL